MKKTSSKHAPIRISESTKITLTVGQIKQLVREFYSSEDYYNDLIDRRNDAEAAYERWAEGRFNDKHPDALKIFWNENIGDCEVLKDKVTDVFKGAPELKYELWWDNDGDPYMIRYTITTPDGKEFWADGDSILPSDYNVVDKTWKDEDQKCRQLLAPYFKNGNADIAKLVSDICDFEKEVNNDWDDTPKMSDEYDPDWDSDDDGDYAED